VASASVANPALTAMGQLQYDAVNVAVLGKNQAAAQKIYDQVGWK
jgi:iron(III) transport system substrate-binding protein